MIAEVGNQIWQISHRVPLLGPLLGQWVGPFIGTAFGTTWSVFALNRQEVTNTPLASSDDSSVIQMMEQDMAKLPL